MKRQQSLIRGLHRLSPAWRCVRPKSCIYKRNRLSWVMTAYCYAMRFRKFGLTTGIFVLGQIFVIIIIQFGGNLFRYYLVFVRQIIIVFVIVIVNEGQSIIVLVIIIVNENITGSTMSSTRLLELVQEAEVDFADTNAWNVEYKVGTNE